MKPSETKKILTLLRCAYPRQEVNEGTATVYADMLADLDPDQVAEAVKKHIATSQYFPTIAEIRASVAEKKCAAPSAAGAWAEVMHAIAAVGRYRTPTFTHPAITAAVEGLGGFQSLCDSDQAQTDRAHFLRLYSEGRARAVECANLPGEKVLSIADARLLKERNAP
jgi:hypothetical protein